VKKLREFKFFKLNHYTKLVTIFKNSGNPAFSPPTAVENQASNATFFSDFHYIPTCTQYLSMFLIVLLLHLCPTSFANFTVILPDHFTFRAISRLS
jgi:hypothetical protein